MQRLALRIRALLRKAFNPALEAILGGIAVGILRATRYFDPNKSADAFARVARRIGPWLPEHRIGRENLAAAFPEKAAAEIEAILGEVWDNLGRVGAEFAHMDRVFDINLAKPDAGRITFSQRTGELFEQLRNDGKGALIFSAHLANWELPALAGPAFDLDSAVLFRRPNLVAVDRAIQKVRGVNMGRLVATAHNAPFQLAQALGNGAHVGMLIDQFHDRGVHVDFFGRPARTNTMLARVARHSDCPIHGVRVIRLPGHRFRFEITEAIAPVRDASGDIDVKATMQLINGVIEGWVREYPGQWLWLHRRWRNY